MERATCIAGFRYLHDRELAPDGRSHIRIGGTSKLRPSPVFPVTWQKLFSRPDPGHHIVQLYRDKVFFAEAVSRFVGEGLRQSECVIVMASDAHWVSVSKRLEQAGVDLGRALQQGQIQAREAGSALAGFMEDGMPQWNPFRKEIGGAIAQGIRSHGRVRVFGEMVDILWRDGRREAAIRLEEFWNRLGREQQFSLLCAYFLDNLDRSIYGGPLECICRSHSHLIPTPDSARLDAAVGEAALQVLGKPLASMLSTLARRHKPPAEMPHAQAMLFWLGANMPHTAEKVLSRVREQLVEDRARQAKAAGGMNRAQPNCSQ